MYLCFIYVKKKPFDQPCLVIANLLAHYVLKIGNNWLYKGHWQGKIFRKICEFFFLACWLKLLPGMPETSRYFL